jgi:hypothetical protein
MLSPVVGIAILILSGRAVAYDGDCAQWKKGTPQYAECVQENAQDRTDIPAVHMSGRMLDATEQRNLQASQQPTAANTMHADSKGPSGRSKAEQIIEQARQAARDAGQRPVGEK